MLQSPLIDFENLPDEAPDINLRELLDISAHYGHETKHSNPQMNEWVYAEQNGVQIFDLPKTAEQLRKAYNFAYKLGEENKNIIFVGTKRQAKDVIEEAAERAGAMYITSRWLGGFITNWDQVKESLQRMLKLERGLNSDQFENYTKYEQVQFQKEAGRLERFFGGVRKLKSTPDALFIIDPARERIPVEESMKHDVPVIALADSDADPTGIDILIPANDDAQSSISYFVNMIADAYEAGRAGKAAATKKSSKKKTEADEAKEAKAEEKDSKDAKAEKEDKSEAKAEKKDKAKKEEKKSPKKKAAKKSAKSKAKPKDKDDAADKKDKADKKEAKKK